MGREADHGRPEVDPLVAELAARQHGVVSVAQLRAIGLSSRAAHHRASRGKLHRVHRGVYAVGHWVLGPDGWRMAAVLACGPGAVLSHRSAADLWGIRRSARTRHEVTRVGGSALRTVEVHRTRSLVPEDVTTIRGIPVTTLARTLRDCAAVLPRQALARCLHEAEILRILDVAAIEGAPGARGAATLTSLIAEYAPSRRTKDSRPRSRSSWRPRASRRPSSTPTSVPTKPTRSGRRTA